MNQPDAMYYEVLLRDMGYSYVAGVDEVGRGAWAGPVYAGAVVLPVSHDSLAPLLSCVRDSKQLSAAARGVAFDLIVRHALYTGIGTASSEEVDSLGIARATRLAWERAIGELPRADFLLLDYFPLPESGLPQLPLTHGDARSVSIGAASILAKVARDCCMAAHARTLPAYCFDRNKGYGTAAHRDALQRHGPCELHRLTWLPLRQLQRDE